MSKCVDWIPGFIICLTKICKQNVFSAGTFIPVALTTTVGSNACSRCLVKRRHFSFWFCFTMLCCAVLAAVPVLFFLPFSVSFRDSQLLCQLNSIFWWQISFLIAWCDFFLLLTTSCVNTLWSCYITSHKQKIFGISTADGVSDRGLVWLQKVGHYFVLFVLFGRRAILLLLVAVPPAMVVSEMLGDFCGLLLFSLMSDGHLFEVSWLHCQWEIWEVLNSRCTEHVIYLAF